MPAAGAGCSHVSIIRHPLIPTVCYFHAPPSAGAAAAASQRTDNRQKALRASFFFSLPVTTCHLFSTLLQPSYHRHRCVCRRLVLTDHSSAVPNRAGHSRTVPDQRSARGYLAIPDRC